MNTEETYARIVAAEKPCEPAGTGPKGLCTSCGGTGKVAVLPLLRELCSVGHPHPAQSWEHSKHYEKDCPGWQAKRLDFETFTAALRDAGFSYVIESVSPVTVIIWLRGQASDSGEWGHGTTDLEALLGATARALEVGVEE